MKERLDIMLFNLGKAESREKAKALIMAGIVYVNGVKADKAGIKVGEDDEIVVKGTDHPYVSRGGLKLEKALKVFEIDVNGLVGMDIGASSGGFTDCLLQKGATKVYSIDVGYGQFAYKLRIDDRTVVLERTNFRNMPFELVGEKVDIAVMDVSFISVLKLADNLMNFLKEDSKVVLLIKPQFEAERELVGKNGVVKGEKNHCSIVTSVVEGLRNKGFYLRNIDFSPIKGPKGNIEFIACFSLDKKYEVKNLQEQIKNCVNNAYISLKKDGERNEL